MQEVVEGLQVLRVVSETALRCPCRPAGDKAGRAPLLPAVEHRIVARVDHRLIAEGPAPGVGEGEIAVVIETEIALEHGVIVVSASRARRLIEAHVGGGRVRFSRQGRGVERRLVLRLPSQQFLAEARRWHVAGQERRTGLAITLVGAEEEDTIALDRTARRPAKLVERQRGPVSKKRVPRVEVLRLEVFKQRPMKTIGARLGDQIHVARKRLPVLGGDDSLHHLYFLNRFDAHRIDVVEVSEQRSAASFRIAISVGAVHRESGGGPAQTIEAHTAIAIAVSGRRTRVAHRYARADAQQIGVVAARQRKFGHHFAIDAFALFGGHRVHLGRGGVHVHSFRGRADFQCKCAANVLRRGQFDPGGGIGLEPRRLDADIVDADPEKIERKLTGGTSDLFLRAGGACIEKCNGGSGYHGATGIGYDAVESRGGYLAESGDRYKPN